jgi:hypothetical protein
VYPAHADGDVAPRRAIEVRHELTFPLGVAVF